MNDDSHVIPTQLMRVARVMNDVGLRGTATALASFVLHPRRIGKGMVVRTKHVLSDYLDGKPADLQRVAATLLVMAMVQPTLPAETTKPEPLHTV